MLILQDGSNLGQSMSKKKVAHYNKHKSGVECIDIVEHMNFNLGNVIKYVWRCNNKHKKPVGDLKKAIYYLEREIARIDKKNVD